MSYSSLYLHRIYFQILFPALNCITALCEVDLEEETAAAGDLFTLTYVHDG